MAVIFKLKRLLALREMTQKDLASMTGIRPPTISAICTNTAKHLPVDVLNRICKSLDCQPADLLEYIPDPPPAD
jgi:Predicted transcriptional regulator